MASSHTLKKPNTGEGTLSVQEKSMQVRIPGGKADHVKEKENLALDEPERRMVEEKYRPSTPTVLGTGQYLLPGVVKYDYNDLLIAPIPVSNIKSRYLDVNPFYNVEGIGEHLPLLTAPMDTVVNHDNAYIFQGNKIGVVLPRTENKRGRLFSTFTSYGLKDEPQLGENDRFVLLDVANGHMSYVLYWCTILKNKYPHIKIMAGNIANPETYKLYCESSVIDYARVGIGNGNGCLTTQQTGVGYPMASLVRECYDIKQSVANPVKIIADGGIKNYSDIIKALALGADYVMVGSLFSKALESAAPLYWKGIHMPRRLGGAMWRNGFDVKKQFRGMSTKAAQKALGNTVTKTSEGVVRMYDIEYTLPQWKENFESYLRSAMSYAGANSLENFIGKAQTVLISQNAFNRFNK